MKNIEVLVLNQDSVKEAEKMAVAMARLTQHGEKIQSAQDFMKLYDKPYSDKFVHTLTKLPHPTLQKFGVINVIVIGASRRFLAQITRHQNEVKFMSASLQYSNYSDDAQFAVPYEILNSPAEEAYIADCQRALKCYETLIADGVNNDAAGYVMPQGLRNVLLISATPYQLKHMINQRVCRRNTDETRIVMLKIWQALYDLSPALFSDHGPFCMEGECKEGKMSCFRPISRSFTPESLLRNDYPKLFGEEDKPARPSEVFVNPEQLSMFEEMSRE